MRGHAWACVGMRGRVSWRARGWGGRRACTCTGLPPDHRCPVCMLTSRPMDADLPAHPCGHAQVFLPTIAVDVGLWHTELEAAASFGLTVLLGALIGGPGHGLAVECLGQRYGVAGTGDEREAGVVLCLMGSTSILAGVRSPPCIHGCTCMYMHIYMPHGERVHPGRGTLTPLHPWMYLHVHAYIHASWGARPSWLGYVPTQRTQRTRAARALVPWCEWPRCERMV